jgi:hypothetical protein
MNSKSIQSLSAIRHKLYQIRQVRNDFIEEQGDGYVPMVVIHELQKINTIIRFIESHLKIKK